MGGHTLSSPASPYFPAPLVTIRAMTAVQLKIYLPRLTRLFEEIRDKDSLSFAFYFLEALHHSTPLGRQLISMTEVLNKGSQ